MGQILEFLPRTDSFGPDAIEILSKAYDMAVKSLLDVGQPMLVREVIAKRIIKAAQKGERDPAKLCAVALSAFNPDMTAR